MSSSTAPSDFIGLTPTAKLSAVTLLERAANKPGSRPRRRLWRRAAVAAVAVLVLVAGGVLGWQLIGGGSSDAGTVSLLGDPRTADPCALTDPAVLGRFGEAEQDKAYGNFDRCDVLVYPDGDAPVDVAVHLDEGPVEEGAQPTKRVGAIGILEPPEESDACVRLLTLPSGDHGSIVVVTADYADGPGTTPLCEIVDEAAPAAARVLDAAYQAGHQIPRRPPFAAESLARLDACTLLDGDALAAVIPGVDANGPDIGYGRWKCSWLSTSDDIEAELRFDQRSPLDASDGRPTRIGGRDTTAVTYPATRP